MSKFLEFFVLIGAVLAKFFCHPITLLLIISFIYCYLQIRLACGLTRRRRYELCCQLYDQLCYKGPARSGIDGLMDNFQNTYSGLISMEYTFMNEHKDPTYRKLRIVRNILFGVFGILYVACCYAILNDPITNCLLSLHDPSIDADIGGIVISIAIGTIASVGLPLASDVLYDAILAITDKAKKAKQKKHQEEIAKIFRVS